MKDCQRRIGSARLIWESEINRRCNNARTSRRVRGQWHSIILKINKAAVRSRCLLSFNGLCSQDENHCTFFEDPGEPRVASFHLKSRPFWSVCCFSRFEKWLEVDAAPEDAAVCSAECELSASRLMNICPVISSGRVKLFLWSISSLLSCSLYLYLTNLL